MFNVYKITNKINGKSYIGITGRSTQERYKEHLSRANSYIRNNRIYVAMRKYGIENFEVTTIDQIDCEGQVRKLEEKYILQFDTFKNGYNCNLGGCGTLVISDETKEKISKSQIGKIISLESRLKMSKAKIGDSKCAKNFGGFTGKGESNPKCKYIKVKLPDGRIEVHCGMRDFCRRNKISTGGLRKGNKGFELLGIFNDYPEMEYS